MAGTSGCVSLAMLDSVVFPTGTRLVDLTGTDFQQAAEWRTRWATASVEPTLQAVRRRTPELSVSTPEVVKLAAELGFRGRAYAQAIRVYYAVDTDGTPGERQLPRHEALDMRCALAILESFGVSNRNEAGASFRVYPTSQGGADAVQSLGSVSLLAGAQNSNLWTLGPGKFGSAWIDNIESWSLAVNPQIERRNANGETEDCLVRLRRTDPQLTINGPGVRWFRTYGLRGTSFTGFRLFLRKQDPNGDVYPNDQKVHAYLEVPAGKVLPDGRTGGVDNAAETTLTVRPNLTNSGSDLLRVVPNVAIS